MTRRFGKLHFLAMVTMIALFAAATLPAAFAQAELGGRLRGTVVDPQGAAVNGAAVALKNQGTSVVRTATTNSSGEFVFIEVPASTYSLTISMTGFRTASYDNVTINLNEVRVLNAKLEVGSNTETVEVTGEAASVVSQEPTLRNTVDERRLEELPLNGRDFANLTFYSAGVTRGAGGNGQGSGFNVAGARGTVNNFLIDGGDANDPTVPFGFATDVVANGLPIDAVQEFSVITSNAGAEFGRNSGGIVNVITKSGTNAFHGTLWEYHRDKALDSRTFFDPAGFKSPFIQNQFGFIFTGPVIKNKLFFSGTYERFKQIQTVSNKINVPSPVFLNSINTATPNGALMKAILQGGFPAATGTTGSANIGTFTTPVDNGGTNDSYFTRVDYNLNSKNQLFFDYQYSNGTEAPGSQGGTVPGTRVGLLAQNYHGIASWNDAITPNLLNTFRWVFQRNVLGFPTDAPPAALLAAGALRTSGPFAGQPYSANTASPNGVPTMGLGTNGFANLGVASNFPQGRVSNTFQYEDTVSWVHGNHQFKFGGQVSRIQENDNFGANIRPAITFTNAATGAFLTQGQFSYLNNQPTKYFRETDYGFFAQDSWRIMRRLTVDLGLRYELNMPIREKNNQISNLFVLDSNSRPIACKAIPVNGQLQNVAIVVPHQFGQDMYCTDTKDFAPRVGVAWDVFGSGKTVVRSSYGIFYDRIFSNALANARFSPPFTISSTIGGPAPYDGRIGATSLASIPNAVIAPTTIDPSLKTPYTQRWNLTVAQQVEKNTSVTVSYVGSRGLRLAENLNPNFGGGFAGTATCCTTDVFRPTNGLLGSTATRSAADIANNTIRAPFGNINDRTTHAYSNYHGLEVALNHRFSYGLSFQANYTWSHSLDVISDEISNGADSAAPPATINNLLAPLMVPGSPCAGAIPGAPPANPVTSATLTAAVRCVTGNPALTTDQAAAIFVSSFVQGVPLSTNYGDSAFDVRHRFSSTMVYELPFGQGRHWGSGWHGPLNQALGGWEITNTFEAQSGSTAPLSDNYDANRDGTANDRPILTGPLSALLVNGQGAHFVDASGNLRGFAACAGATGANPMCPSLDYGQGILNPKLRLGRGAVRGPGLWDLDFGTYKNFKLTERFGLQFRAEMFNVLNHTNFLRPIRNLTSPGTFGLIQTQRTINGTQSRQFQFAMKLKF